jgi:hypothetical protein
VRKELIERPLSIKRFEFEALQVLKLVNDGVLEVYENFPKKRSSQLLSLANNSFQVDHKNIELIQSGEIESVASALELGAETVVMDERTLRLMIEDSFGLRHLLEKRFKEKVLPNQSKISQFQQQLRSVRIIRSIELVAAAYKLGLFEEYIPEMKDGREILLDSILWAVKSNGCAVSEEEIEEMKKLLRE